MLIWSCNISFQSANFILHICTNGFAHNVYCCLFKAVKLEMEQIRAILLNELKIGRKAADTTRNSK